MKKILLLIALCCVVSIGFSQENKGLARVNKLQGIEVYALSEPLRAYDVLFDVGTGMKTASLMTGGVVNEGVSDKLGQFVKKANKEAEKKNQKIDAIIYSDGKTVIAVKFKEEGTAETKGIGRVKKLEGKEVYVMSEPVADYETMVDVSTGAKAKSYFTGGLVNNSVEEDMAQYVKRAIKEAEKDTKKIDAVVYTGGKRAIGVTFK